MEFGANIPLNGTIACTEIAIVDDSVFEGNEQNFTATIDFVGFAGSPADNLMCVSDCEATVTIEDNAADCKLLTYKKHAQIKIKTLYKLLSCSFVEV